MRIILSVLSASLVVAAIGAAYACTEPYPPSMVNAFVQNCGKDQRMVSFCGCVIDSLQKEIPLADFIEIGSKPGGINNDSRFVKLSKACMTKFPLPAGQTGVPATK